MVGPMSSATSTDNKAAVRAFYDGAARGDISGFRSYLHPCFVCSAPRYLPWGGDTHGADAYLNVVLPQVARALDFGRFSYDCLTAEDEHVVALINVGVMDTESMIKISEHWILEDGRARSIWIACFEPAALLFRLERDRWGPA